MPLDASYTGKDFKSVGTRPLRPDGIDKVTGRAKYGADHNMPGQLVGLDPALARMPMPRSRRSTRPRPRSWRA